MRISREQLIQQARQTGHRPEMLEKVIHLLNLLQELQNHPFLRGKLALKGGTALNLFVFDAPRLSIDIDLNYIGLADRDAMLAERPKIERAVEGVCSREGMTVIRMPADHAGGKWSLRYLSAINETAVLALDLNFVYRVPLWPVVSGSSRRIGSYEAHDIPMLDVHELAAGKLAALLSRHAGRDLFDAHRLLTSGLLEPELLRLGFIVYGAMNRKDWRTVRAEDVDFDDRELQNELLPLLRDADVRQIGPLADWALHMVTECRKALSMVLPFAQNEREFLSVLLDRGRIDAALLTHDGHLAGRIERHPLLLWKAQNVRKHKGSQE